MKKTFCFSFILLLFISLLLPLLASTDVYAENQNLVNCIFTAKADPRFSAGEHTMEIVVYNRDEDEEFRVQLYPYANYISRVNLPEGSYKLTGFVADSDPKHIFSVKSFKFDAYGLSVEIPLEIGDVNYTGEINEIVYIDGVIDREATDKKMVENGGQPIDWEKFDSDVEKLANTSKKDLEKLYPTQTSDNTENGDIFNKNNDDSDNDTDEPDKEEQKNNSDNSSKKDNSSNNKDDEENNKDNGKLSVKTIIIFIVIVAGVAIALFIRFKNNQLGGDIDE